MSPSQYRSQLERKRKQRLDAEKKAIAYRAKESTKRGAAVTARLAASKAGSSSTAKSKNRDAERAEKDALSAANEASKWSDKASRYAKEEAQISDKLTKAERSAADDDERRRNRERQRAERISAADRALLVGRLESAETAVNDAMRELRAPKPEKLRVLLLGASSAGDLRVGREQARIRAAVQSALHRDLIEIDMRPAATTADLLDGITRFRPHVVHFSGHGNADLIEFEQDLDDQHQGVGIAARAVASAIAGTDDPPLLVLLNACHSASQIQRLVDGVVPFAIGMSDEIEDADAITYAAQFYAAVANGQSVKSAHLSAQAALELAGLEVGDLPTLACALNVDPRAAILVQPFVMSE